MITLKSYHQDRKVWRKRWYAEGYFGSSSVPQVLDEAARSKPQTPFHYYGSQRHPEQAMAHRTTARELLGESRGIAGALYAAGVRQGEVFAVQLPTWHETTVLYLAALRLGAVVLPIVHSYGPREVEFILQQSGARTLVIPNRWRGVDFIENFERMAPAPNLQRVIVISDQAPAGMVGWPQLLRHAGDPFPSADPDPDQPCVLIYTSGTSAAPKGVLFSHNNLQSEWRSPFFHTAGPYLCNFPAGHIAGFNFALRPLVTGTPVVYFDHWDARLAARLIEEHRISETGGTGFFLKELIRARDLDKRDLNSVKFYTLGGTGVTAAEVQFAEQNGFMSGRVYGSTEHSTVTGIEVNLPFYKRANTDGRPVRGNHLRIVDDQGQDVSPGTHGELVTQGPELFIGYTDDTLNSESFLPGGWFRTGDLGRLDEEGFLTIIDRKKDIVIRGGENISSIDVENVLGSHPMVQEVAVTAMPDQRYGEVVCAFVRLKSGARLGLAEVREFFAEAGMMRQKTPERLIVVDDFPRTPSSKIKKYELRKRFQQEMQSTQPTPKSPKL